MNYDRTVSQGEGQGANVNEAPCVPPFCGVTDTWGGISFSQHSWYVGMLSLLDRWINWNMECLSHLPWVTAHLRKTESSCDWNHGVPDYTVGVLFLLSSFLRLNTYSLVYYTEDGGWCLSIRIPSANFRPVDSKIP